MMEQNQKQLNSADRQLSGLQLRLNQAYQFAQEKLGPSSDKLHRLITPKNLIIGGSVLAPATIFALGVMEGAKLSDGNVPFSLAYGLDNMTRAITWVRQDPTIVALANEIPQDILNQTMVDALNGVVNSPEMARAKIAMDINLDIRGSIADGTLMVWFITGVFAVKSAGEKLRQRILEGVETIRRNDEQIIFLGGDQSGVLNAVFSTDPQHILPVVERTEAISELTEIAKTLGEHGFYLKVDGNDYNSKSQWQKLKFRRNWLTATNDGSKKYMIVVGDGSTYEEAIDLKDQSQQDLTVKELQVTVERLTERAVQNGISKDDFQPVSVYIGNARLLRKSGKGKYSISDRQLSDKYQSVDVWVDTRAPIIDELKTWLNGKKYFAFDAIEKEEYFRNLSKLMKAEGIKVYDMLDPKKPKDTPVLVYEEKTAYTVTKAKNMIKQGLATKENVATLTDTLEGYNDSENAGIKSICSAKIYMDEVFAIREKLKQGLTPEAIQQELDQRWHSPGLIQ